LSDNNTEQNQELDRKDLKILALRQNLNELEDKYSDLQVEATILQNQLQSAIKEIERLSGEQEAKRLDDSVKSAVSTGDVSTD